MSDGDGFEPIENIPESSKTLLVLTVLEDLSDSQLVLSIDERGTEPRQYLALISILANAVSMLSGRYAVQALKAQVEVAGKVSELYDRLGMENPFKSETSLEDSDVEGTIDEISRFLDEDTGD